MKDPGLTEDPHDPALGRGVDTHPVPQNKKYLVLSEEERQKGYRRPLRFTYTHATCGANTTMSRAIAETYAREPTFYGSTYCATCRMHRPLDEFTWKDSDEKVGS